MFNWGIGVAGRMIVMARTVEIGAILLKVGKEIKNHTRAADLV